MALTPKRKLFADKYLKGLVGSAAYREAGYKGNDRVCEVEASKLLRVPEVAAYIQERMNKRAQKLELDAEYVLNNIKTIGERCMNAEKLDAQGALKAQELLGKHLKLFTDKTELTGKDGAALMPTINVRFVKPGE